MKTKLIALQIDEILNSISFISKHAKLIALQINEILNSISFHKQACEIDSSSNQ